MKQSEKDEFPLTPEEEKVLLKTSSRVFSTAFPNPDAKGCPDPPTLKKLVYRSESFTLKEREHWFAHTANCSPCFTKMSSLRQAFVRKRSVKRSILAVLAVGVLSWLLVKVSLHQPPGQPQIVKPQSALPPATGTPEPAPPAPSPVPPSAQEQKPAEVQVVVLDLRKRGVARGQNNNQDADLDLPKGRLKLSIYLPIGSEEGNYEVRISRRQKQVLTAKGKAGMQAHLNVLTVEADTSAFEAGSYTLDIREVGWGWNRYPLRVR
jgi:hypothetical protein